MIEGISSRLDIIVINIFAELARFRDIESLFDLFVLDIYTGSIILDIFYDAAKERHA